MMNKLELTRKYKHTLTLKNYSSNTIDSYLNRQSPIELTQI